MKTIRIYDLLRRRVLVTRDSARAIEPELAAALVEGDVEVALDFSGVEGLTPSFFDETLSIIEEHIDNFGSRKLKVTLLHPPTNLSAKFAAVGRSHDIAIRESGSDAWVIYEARSSDPHTTSGASASS